MSFTKLSSAFSASPQISEADVERAAREGFRLVIDCRPDDEEQGQPNFRDVAEWAVKHGLSVKHVPVTPSDIHEGAVADFAGALATAGGPVLGYCKSGRRASALWALSQAMPLGAETVLAAAKAAEVRSRAVDGAHRRARRRAGRRPRSGLL